MKNKWMITSLLNRPTDNISLVLFRIGFGFLMIVECWGAIGTGWVYEAFVEPTFTFTYFDLTFTQILLGKTMYWFYFVMGVFAFGVMLGYYYRVSTFAFALLWTLSFLMQKSHYNNHYYLVVLLSGMMFFVPANASHSLDSHYRPKIKSNACPYWCILIFILHIAILYFYGFIAKLYPDWLNATPINIWFTGKVSWFQKHFGENFFIIPLLKSSYFQYFVSYAGIGYDFLVVPLLLYSRTRFFAVLFSFGFHLFNSLVFQVGIFPYMGLLFIIFFYPPQTLQRIFLRQKTISELPKIQFRPIKSLPLFLFVAYFTFQIVFPIRHWVVEDNVFWTEEGHRFSWRMMLRSKGARVKIWAETPDGKREQVKLKDYLNQNQAQAMSSKPDMIWQFSQHIEKEYQKKGFDHIKVFVDCKVSLNHRPYEVFIDPEADLTSVDWNYFGKQSWILPSPESYFHYSLY